MSIPFHNNPRHLKGSKHEIFEQGPIPKEMSQTLLTNKKQGNLDKAQAANIIKPK